MTHAHLAAVFFVMAASILPGLAQAQEGSLLVRPADGELGSQHNKGYYQGVVPGEGHSPPRERRIKQTKRNNVTWPGFELTSEGSRIFLQSTRPVTYTRRDEPNRIVLVLRNTAIHLRNNRNPLVTEHFNTPVARAYLRHSRRDTLLIVEMKVNVEPSIHQVSEDGYHFLFLEFPSGSYPIPEGVRSYRIVESEEPQPKRPPKR